MSDLGPFLASTMDYWQRPVILALAALIWFLLDFMAAVESA